MTFNEAMIKHNFISKILLKVGNKELSKDLKVKLMSMRIKLGKVRKELDDELQEVIQQLTPEGYKELVTKPDKTEDDKKQIETWNQQINDEYNAYLNKKGQEDVDITVSITEDEFSEIIEVNADNDVEINGQKLNAADFLEVFYSLFVV